MRHKPRPVDDIPNAAGCIAFLLAVIAVALVSGVLALIAFAFALMKKLACIAFLAVASLALAQEAPPKVSAELTYDLTAKKVVAGASYDVGLKVTDLFGRKGFNAELRPFAGLTDSAVPTFGGIAVVRCNRLSKEFFLDVGLGGRVASKEPFHGFLYLGVGRKF